uniref:Uncharacterized protein n=1 Tax=Cacopsylla melanoneura TaxID=428564 RepID=A0A8D8PMG9_9HEMI
MLPMTQSKTGGEREKETPNDELNKNFAEIDLLNKKGHKVSLSISLYFLSLARSGSPSLTRSLYINKLKLVPSQESKWFPLNRIQRDSEHRAPFGYCNQQ